MQYGNVDSGELKLLLVKRGKHPYKNAFALPGGFVGIDETIEEARGENYWKRQAWIVNS